MDVCISIGKLYGWRSLRKTGGSGLTTGHFIQGLPDLPVVKK